MRPRIEENKGFQTPFFKAERMNGWTCPRDVLTVVGNEVIEAATPWRTRNYEVCCVWPCEEIFLMILCNMISVLLIFKQNI